MAVHVSESDGNLTLIGDGSYRGLKLEDAEEFLDDLEQAIESAKEHRG